MKPKVDLSEYIFLLFILVLVGVAVLFLVKGCAPLLDAQIPAVTQAHPIQYYVGKHISALDSSGYFVHVSQYTRGAVRQEYLISIDEIAEKPKGGWWTITENDTIIELHMRWF